MRGKAMNFFLKKRDQKMKHKRSMKKMLKDGQDGDAYIENAFEWSRFSQLFDGLWVPQLL